MPYEPLPSFLRRRAPALAAALATVALLPAGVALATPGSSRLSAQGWRTFSAFRALDAPTAGPGAHAKLQRVRRSCRRLPGHGTQSAGIRKICLGEVGFVDRLVGVMQCSDAGGGGDEAQGLCFLAALPAIDRDLDLAARGSGAVVATLAPGRCRRGFAHEQLTMSSAAARGRDLLGAVGAQDAAGAQRASDRLTTALERAAEPSFGSGAGCRPRS